MSVPAAQTQTRTGEFQLVPPAEPPRGAQPVSHQSTITVSLAIVAVGAAISVGVLFNQVQTLREEQVLQKAAHVELVRENAREHATLMNRNHSIELRQVAVEGDIRRMADSVQSMDTKMENIGRRLGVRQ